MKKGSLPAGFSHGIDQIADLFGSGVRRRLGPLAISDWSRMEHVRRAYSYALPRKTEARDTLARPFARRLFFAGEATERHDFSTAHGAYQRGMRASNEVIAAIERPTGARSTS